ncbi:unnamed protein product (macronuclear) [Paramecium tetraurelia]|uniref:U3 small nucleolar RNA-associated protein 14 n=1 Tax=Paramecium tetraurelia TaxID=5888 RepID=A0DDR0_PARTE|nr:uncharacterized protein GSPATT00016018001 [Paramecium tetraurelia]CAK81177.1 unnamed protein product [Paramecium tetraurelia]|eukprot:XP_001448574.1 hypothetical protein (macronuclear) [Paramecium tetraurelia strain d4-2]
MFYKYLFYYQFKYGLEKQLAKKVEKQDAYQQVKLQETPEDDFNVANLIQTLEDQGQQIESVKTQYLRVHEKAVSLLNQTQRIVQEPETQAERDLQERKVAATVMKQDIKKWLPIVKKNRESERLDFTKQRNVQISKISDTSNALLNNHLGVKLQNAMEEVEKVEQKQELNGQSNQQKSNLQFYNDLKMKKISSIKSKIYKQIKKKKGNKEKLKLMAQLTPAERRKEIEKLRLSRAKERITLRHSTKNKYVFQLLRFGGDKKSLKQQQSFLNNLKHQLLAKAQLNELEDGEFDEENFREQAITQLEQELLDIERREKEKQNNFGFLDKQKKQDLQQSKSIAQKLLTMLKSGNDDAIQLDESENQEQNSDDNYEPNENGDKDKTKANVENNEFNGRANFVNETKQLTEAQKKKIDAKTSLSNYLNLEPEKQQQPNKIEKQMTVQEEKKQLIEGLNIKNIKQKYEKQVNQKLTNQDLKKLQSDPDELLQQNLANFNLVLDEDENENAFIDEKIKDMEEELPPEPANTKGWGSWAGFGIKERTPLTQEQILQNKIKKIREVQKKRQDAKLDNVIISEKRDNKFAKYLVPKLPSEFANSQQFDQLHTLPLGPEWNSLTSHSALTQPQIVTKAGVVINPVKIPQQVNKLI